MLSFHTMAPDPHKKIFQKKCDHDMDTKRFQKQLKRFFLFVFCFLLFLLSVKVYTRHVILWDTRQLLATSDVICPPKERFPDESSLEQLQMWFSEESMDAIFLVHTWAVTS